jgi:hypothetical protein
VVKQMAGGRSPVWLGGRGVENQRDVGFKSSKWHFRNQQHLVRRRTTPNPVGDDRGDGLRAKSPSPTHRS